MRIMMLLRSLFLLAGILMASLFLTFCGNKDQNEFTRHEVKVVGSSGKVMPKDKLPVPKSTSVEESNIKKIPAGKPSIVQVNKNIQPAGEPTVVKAGEPEIIIPGRGDFSLPKPTHFTPATVRVGIPEIFPAKDMVNKDMNPESFSHFGKLQGIKHGHISCMFQDNTGNLWFGTFGGGATRYDGKYFTYFTEKEGLSKNNILSISQDRSGNLWFCTYGGGVTMYDGKVFKRFSQKEGLPGNDIYCMLEDRKGNIWFGVIGIGVSRFDGTNFTNYTEKEGLKNFIVSSMIEDRSGTLWFGTLGGGIIKFDGQSFSYYTLEDGLCSNQVFCIYEDHTGNLWIGTDGGGVSKFDGKTFSRFTEKEGLSNNCVLNVMEDRLGNLWFGTDGGATKFDGKSFTRYTDKEGLSNNTVNIILQDKSGVIWMGTNAGVSKYNGVRFSHFTDVESLGINGVYGIYEDHAGNLWFGTEGGGVSKYDGKSFYHYTVMEGLSNNNVYSILEDKSGNLWFGTYGGGLSKFDGKSFSHYTEKSGLGNNGVYCLCEDRSGNIWIGTYGGGVSKFDGKNFTVITEKEGLGNNNVLSILEDRAGNIWFGTEGGGATKYHEGVFTLFTEKEGLSNNNISSIVEDRSGNIWFATKGGGVCKYDGRSFTQITDKEGLINNNVLSILEDKTGSLWFGTRFGLSKLTREKLAVLSDKIKSDNVQKNDVFFKNYTYDDGLLGIGCNRNSILESKSGIIWIGTNDRLTAFHPEGEILDTIPPKIQITGIGLYNEKIDWGGIEKNKDTSFLLGNGVRFGNVRFDSLERWNNLPCNLSLAYRNNYITLDFIGITTVQPKNVKYQYKLNGIDDHWSAITDQTSATYGNLPHGDYSFQVKAMNSEGFWSQEALFTFTIRPPWWKTWWMYTIYGLSIAGVIFLILRWNGSRLRKRADKLQAEVEKATLVIQEQKKDVESEKKKSDELLLNILPSEVADELKQTGRCKPKTYSMVTVLFTDFKDFTAVSERISAELLVGEIDYCFSAFDSILQKYKIEKIKTIGDAYMCAAGLPVLTHTHAFDIVSAAIEIRDFIQERKKEKIAKGEIPFDLRLGIHTGPVVAGIVGKRKYVYDIWGDTVNIAARMEQNSEAGKINISGITHLLVKDQFICTHRGKIQAKNKGEIDMYFVESKPT